MPKPTLRAALARRLALTLPLALGLAAAGVAQSTAAEAVTIGPGVFEFVIEDMGFDASAPPVDCWPGYTPTHDAWFRVVGSGAGTLRFVATANSANRAVFLYAGEPGALVELDRMCSPSSSDSVEASPARGESLYVRVVKDPGSFANRTLRYVVNVGAQPLAFRVKDTGPAGGGLSWDSPYRNLQQAIDDAARSGAFLRQNMEVWVARGIYKTDETPEAPLGTGDRSASFVLRDWAHVYGGFEGTETSIGQRELFSAADASILSGEINGPTPDDNALHVVRAGTTFNGMGMFHITGVLNGFTILGGNADVQSSSSDDAHGGGLLANRGRTWIYNCTFDFNRSFWGGGGAAVRGGANAVFVNCRFRFNRSGGGAGLMIRDATGRARQCLFQENVADVLGGGMMAWPAFGDMPVHSSTFVRNRAPSGAGLFVGGAGRVDLVASSFHRNANQGGGVPLGASSLATVDPGAHLTTRHVFAEDVAGTLEVAGGGTWTNHSASDFDSYRPNLDLPFQDEPGRRFRAGASTPLADAADPGLLLPDHGDIDQDGIRTEPTPLDLELGPRVVGPRFAASAYEPQATSTESCSPSPNASYASGAELLVYGSDRVADGEMVLRAVGTTGSAGLFIVGTLPGTLPAGEGTLCIADPVRLELIAGTEDTLDYAVDFDLPEALGLLTPGSTLYFQGWFRDTDAGGAPSYNFSSAVRVELR
ncbi:MAG: right-handed parallel beta-helix repeat-containing protein [Planctomycetota bacterium]